MTATAQVGGSNGPLAGGGLWTIEPVQAAAYTALPGDFVPVDTTSAAVTITLPTAPADGTMVAVKMVRQASSHAVTVAAGGADTFNVAMTGATTLTLALLDQGVTLQYKANVAVWYVLSDDQVPGTLGATTFTGIVTENAGTDTAGGAAVIAAPGFSSGVASQLADTTRDYLVYFTIGTGGGTVTIAIGPTSTPANTIVNGAVGVNGEVIPIRLPAGWFLEITVATSTIARQIAVGC